MKEAIFLLAIILIAMSCKKGKVSQIKEDNKDFASLLDKYYDERMHMFPLEATYNGDNRFNNLLPADFHDEFLKDGCMPLDILEREMYAWAKRQVN